MNLIPLLGIALFSHMYGVSCQKCHTVIPHLNDFGAHFLASGDRIPGVSSWTAGTVPISAKVNIVASSANQGDGVSGRGLPKDIVDEVELFSAGTIGSRASYFVEQYAVDGGQHGLLRDAWISERVNPWDARVPVYLQAGSYTLPLPVDPETFRESYQDYAIDVQTVGSNPFNFKDPHYGALATFGDVLRGASLRVFAGPGYDRVSGLRATGTDVMLNLSETSGPFTMTIYNYTGERPNAGSLFDRFSRTGYAFAFGSGRWTSETVMQTGFDSNVNGTGQASSGGLTQLRYALSPRFFALARFEGTNDPENGVSRDAVALLGYGPTRNARITLEDVVTHAPSTSHTVNLQYTIGY